MRQVRDAEMSTTYPQLKYGGTIILKPSENVQIACCDCGLVHTFDFKIVKDTIKVSICRNNRATGQLRRWKKKKK